MKKNLSKEYCRPGTIEVSVFLQNARGGVLAMTLIGILSSAYVCKAEIEIYAAGKRLETKIPVTNAQDIDKISYDAPVKESLIGFQEKKQVLLPGFVSDNQELQEAIRKSLQQTRQPVLLMSDPGTMRIMALTDRNSKK